MKHVIRIGARWLRCPLLVLIFPFSFAHICMLTLWHRPSRLLAFSFYDLAWSVFWASWDGAFVPKSPKGGA